MSPKWKRSHGSLTAIITFSDLFQKLLAHLSEELFFTP